MKSTKSAYACVGLLLLLLASAVSAMAEGGVESSRDYLVERFSMPKWRLGVYMRDQNRDLEFGSGAAPTSVKMKHTAAEIGYSVVRWLTAYLSVGYCELRPSQGSDFGDPEFEKGVGLKARLLDYRISDPRMLEDWFRIDTDLKYLDTKSEYMGSTLEWAEWQADLMFSFTTDCEGNPFTLPKSIVLRAGPVYSGIKGNQNAGLVEVKEHDPFGLGIGLEFYLNDSLSFACEMQKFDSDTTLMELVFRF